MCCEANLSPTPSAKQAQIPITLGCGIYWMSNERLKIIVVRKSLDIAATAEGLTPFPTQVH